MRKNNKALAAIGTPLLALLLMIAAALPAAAQQLPNPGFDNWGGFPSKPEGWDIMNQMGFIVTGSKTDGLNGNKAMLLQNKNIMNQDIPGYFTSGTTWATSEGFPLITNKDGGAYGGIVCETYPDAIRFYYKRSVVDGSTANGSVVAYLWKGTYTQKDVPCEVALMGSPKKMDMVNRDRNILGMETALGGEVIKSDDAELIASINLPISKVTDEWTYLSIPFNYLSDAQPEMANVIFAANDYFDSENIVEDNTLTVAYPKFVYYSRLSSIKINGAEIKDFKNSVYTYHVDALPSESSVTYELMSDHAKAEITSTETAIIITVTNDGEDEDDEAIHTYTLTTDPVESQDSDTYYGAFTRDKFIGSDFSVKGSVIVTANEDGAVISIPSLDFSSDRSDGAKANFGNVTIPVNDNLEGSIKINGPGNYSKIAISDATINNGSLSFTLSITKSRKYVKDEVYSYEFNGATKKIEESSYILTIEDANNTKAYYEGKDYQLNAVLTPQPADEVALVWSSSDENVAEVDGNGHVSILAPGKVTIKAEDNDGNYAYYTINANKFEPVSKAIPGYLTVTNAEGVASTAAVTLNFTTTSWNEVDFLINDLTICGYKLGDVDMTQVGYHADDHMLNDNMEPMYMQVFNDVVNDYTFDKGKLKATVAINPQKSSYIDMTEDVADANIYFDITKTNVGGNMTAQFSTTRPEGFDDAAGPKAGTSLTYDGRFDLTLNDTKYSVESKVVVDYLTDPDAEGYFTANIHIPAISLDEIEMDKDAWGNEPEPEYNYNFEAFTIEKAKGLRKGNMIFYHVENEEVEVGDLYYIATFDGESTDDDLFRFNFSMYDGKELTASGVFTNAAPEEELSADVYNGYLDIDMGSMSIAKDKPASVKILPSEDGKTATFILPDLELDFMGQHMALGDIRLENVEVADENGIKRYTASVEGMKLMAGQIEAVVELNGTIYAEGEANMEINVVWMGQTIAVKFTGTKDGDTTGIEAPGVDAGVVDGPAEYFTIGGVRVAGDHLAPGIYIERRGNQTRKILVK